MSQPRQNQWCMLVTLLPLWLPSLALPADRVDRMLSCCSPVPPAAVAVRLWPPAAAAMRLSPPIPVALAASASYAPAPGDLPLVPLNKSRKKSPWCQEGSSAVL